MKKILLSLVIAISLSGVVNALTYENIEDEVRLLVGDDSSSTTEQYFSSTTITRRANIIQDDIAAKTDCIVRRYFITTVTDTLTYHLPTDPLPLKVLRVDFEDSGSTGTYQKLDYTTMDKLDREYNNWEDLSSGEPLYWYQSFLSTKATSFISVGVKPPPTGDDVGASKLRVDYSHLPAALTATTSVPFNSNPRLYSYHYIIVYGVAMLCSSGVDRVNFKALYDSEIAIMKANLAHIPARSGGITPRNR